VAADDVLIAFVSVNAFADNTVTPGNGWSTLPGFPLGGGGSAVKSVWMFTRVVVSNEPAQHIFSFKSTTNARGVILAYRGVSTTNPILAEAHTVSDTASATPVAPGVNTSLNASVILRVATLAPANHERGLLGPDGLDVRYDSGTGLNLSMKITEERQSAAGPTGMRTFTVVDDQQRQFAEAFTTITLALRPR
jgi:hypothetical protein